MDTAKYLDLFRQEAAEHLATLEAFVASGAPADMPSLQAPFRAAHSLKGMAAAMGFDAIQSLCHALEDGFVRVREGKAAADAPLRSAWVRAVSLLRDQLEPENTPSVAPDDLLLALRAAGNEATANGGPHAASAVPSSAAAASSVSSSAGAMGFAGNSLLVTVHIDPLAALPAARALAVLKRLGTLAPLHAVHPDPAEISAGRFAGKLELKIEANAETVQAALAGLPEVSRVEIRTVPVAVAAPVATAVPASSVRVDSRRLDDMAGAIERLFGLDAALNARLGRQPEAADLLASNRKVLLELAGQVADVRLVPFAVIADRLKIAFQDILVKVGKQAEFRLSGVDTVLDRRVLDELVDPLMHLLRNSLDHGLENSQERGTAGKTPMGVISLGIERRADRAVVTLGDDGRGMNAQKLRDAAVRKGLISAERAKLLDDAEAFELITLPGFSTAETVTDLSGRGVGMDVVRFKIEELGGRMKIETAPGKGTRFILSLPITTLQQSVMLFEWAGRPFGLPLSSLLRAGLAQEWELRKAGPEWQLIEDAAPLPLLSLGTLFSGEPLHPTDPQPYLRLAHEGRALALAASRVIGTAQLPVKSLPPPVNLLPGLAGAAILGDGRVAVMLDPDFLVKGLTARSA